MYETLLKNRDYFILKIKALEDKISSLKKGECFGSFALLGCVKTTDRLCDSQVLAKKDSRLVREAFPTIKEIEKTLGDNPAFFTKRSYGVGLVKRILSPTGQNE